MFLKLRLMKSCCFCVSALLNHLPPFNKIELFAPLFTLKLLLRHHHYLILVEALSLDKRSSLCSWRHQRLLTIRLPGFDLLLDALGQEHERIRFIHI
jgi:hypothetical protein